MSRYENCNFTNNTLILIKNHNQKNSINLQDFEEIENFSSLIAKTGHTQNWTNEDHLLFLKLRKKHKTIPSLVYAIQKKCPDLTTKCIINHEAWYKFYLKLQDQQKSAIKNWRQQKNSKIIQKVENEFHISNKENKINTNKLTKNLTIIDNQKSKELIKKWKEEKENERLMHEEQIKFEMKTKKFLENRRKIRAERLKLAVVEYKEKKRLETNFSKDLPKESKLEKIIKSPNLIMSFR